MAPEGDLSSEWQQWRQARLRRLLSPTGPLALTGTNWFDDSLTLDGLPGTWQATAGGASLTAAASEGVTVDGVLLDGTIAVCSDLAPAPTTVIVGDVRLVLIERDSVLAVRVYDPAAVGAAGLEGLDIASFDPSWRLPARFVPHQRTQQIVVPNADGVDRPLDVAGVIEVELAGQQYRLAVERDPDDGVLQAMFADTTSGATSYRFRFLLLPSPDATGRTIADFNRAHLPPCAFNDHFVCPFPPPGNTLDVPVNAGEMRARWRAAD